MVFLTLRLPLLIRLWRPRLWDSRVSGRLIYWLASEGRPTAFALGSLVASILAALVDPVFWIGVGALVVLLLVLWALRARSAVAIDEFSDQTPGKSLPTGAATLLSIELARIADLFRVVDERNTLQTAVGDYQPLEAALKVDELTNVLTTSVTAETKLKLGPIEIPIGTGMILLGRVVQGPRLRCQVHEIGDQLVLSAQLSGLRVSPAWRLERRLEAKTPAERALALNDMIPELASRLFTNLGLRRKIKWRAMRSFTTALGRYRSCLRTPKDRAVKLLHAQQHLVEALAYDEDFALVYYNLGVVYGELSRLASGAGRDIVAVRHRQAAERAFTKAVEQDPTRWESYYALARLQFDGKSQTDGRDLCYRVLTLSAGRGGDVERAKARDLIAHWDGHVTRETLAHRRHASLSALRALGVGYLKRRSVGSEDDRVPTLADLAANCISNLAVDEAKFHRRKPRTDARPWCGWRLWRLVARHRRIVVLFKLAQRLTPKSANLHFALGKIATERHDHRRAIRELTSATRAEPERARFWAYLARAYSGAGMLQEAEDACRRAEGTANLLALKPDGEDHDAVAVIVDTWRVLGHNDEAARLERQRDFALRLRAQAETLGKGDLSIAGVATKCDEGRTWEAAHLAFVLGQRRLRAPERRRQPHPAVEAEDLFRVAIAILDRDGGLVEDVRNRALRRALKRVVPERSAQDIMVAEPAKDVVRHDLRAYLARALAPQKGKNAVALAEAQKAVSQNPLSSVAFDALGHVYNAADDLAGAWSAWKQALLLNPNDAMLHWELGYCCRRLGIESSRLDDRRAFLREATEHLSAASELFAYEELEHRVRVHYWLARVYEELGEDEHVVPTLRLVQASPQLDVVADFLVGQAYRRLRNFNKAEALYEKVIDNTSFTSDEQVEPAAVIEVWPFSVLHGRAKCALAMSYADRLGDLAAAGRLLKHVDEALPALADKNESDPAYQRRLRELTAAYHHARGRVALERGDVEEALRQLQWSIGIRSHPEVYLDLALATWRSALVSAEDAREEALERARQYCTLVRSTDARAVCSVRLDELVPKLDAMRSQPAGAAV